MIRVEKLDFWYICKVDFYLNILALKCQPIYDHTGILATFCLFLGIFWEGIPDLSYFHT